MLRLLLHARGEITRKLQIIAALFVVSAIEKHAMWVKASVHASARTIELAIESRQLDRHRRRPTSS
jgi:hypothetical protein